MMAAVLLSLTDTYSLTIFGQARGNTTSKNHRDVARLGVRERVLPCCPGSPNI